MKYKYFLFDWDGTLGDSLPIWVPAFVETFKEFGVEVTEREIGEHVIANWNGPAELGVTDADAFFRKAAEKLLPMLPEVKLVPGAKAVLEKIKKMEGKIAIVTTSKREWVESALKYLGIANLIDVFLGKEDVRKYKPDPEILLKALDKLGGTKDGAVMIGDHKKDIEAANNAGMDSVLFFPKRYERYYDRGKQLSLGADLVIEDLEELRQIWGE
ncbi:MAG: Phosphoglycolate phosphatase [Candidatus Collierbacteria bacterium GW2011_GWB1_44_6]|uniref:Phosphoglycolate phosphatase n=2 Tax=Candidatus Collieribacteriota TaxID=1752725 RepID=A0A0G1LV55_9BACT|nr:MAG: Phosphoglycolate phosphatase [Candidatus Collierbacteria bacterium GW2011_GWC2_43_12]KKT72667.1 MAG: Phosphoglycolate phosphatase [Candidatus Collierbacteria bacterium GW2011_GWB1_44_6]KKT81946.1 MAG: Phosphoglycolate phosphatase [Microgenomates group bacterium GW2011_GWC1_44_9]